MSQEAVVAASSCIAEGALRAGPALRRLGGGVLREGDLSPPPEGGLSAPGAADIVAALSEDRSLAVMASCLSNSRGWRSRGTFETGSALGTFERGNALGSLATCSGRGACSAESGVPSSCCLASTTGLRAKSTCADSSDFLALSLSDACSACFGLPRPEAKLEACSQQRGERAPSGNSGGDGGRERGEWGNAATRPKGKDNSKLLNLLRGGSSARNRSSVALRLVDVVDADAVRFVDSEDVSDTGASASCLKGCGCAADDDDGTTRACTGTCIWTGEVTRQAEPYCETPRTPTSL